MQQEKKHENPTKQREPKHKQTKEENKQKLI